MKKNLAISGFIWIFKLSLIIFIYSFLYSKRIAQLINIYVTFLYLILIYPTSRQVILISDIVCIKSYLIMGKITDRAEGITSITLTNLFDA